MPILSAWSSDMKCHSQSVDLLQTVSFRNEFHRGLLKNLPQRIARCVKKFGQSNY